MKKLMKIVSAIVLTGALFTSCTKDNTAPTISSATISATSAKPGDVITISATLSDSEAEMDNVVLKKVYNGGSTETETTVDLSSAGGSYNFSYEFTVPAGAKKDDTYSFTIALTDVHKKDPQTVESALSALTVLSSGDPITSYSAKIFGAQSNATLGSYFATTTGTVYTQSNANTNSDKVDFIYFYESEGTSPDNATIAAPNDASFTQNSATLDMATGFTTKNATTFKTSTVTTTAFDAMEDDADFKDITGITATRLTSLAVDDVFYFETAAGKKGMAKVTALTTGGAGSITVDVKVQQ